MSRRSKRTLKWMAVVVIGIFVVGAAVAVQVPIAAQDHGANGPSIAPTGGGKLVPQKRTVADIQAADAALAPAGGDRDEVPPFMPTNPAEYAAAKAAGAGAAGSAAPSETAAVSPLAPPTLQFMNWEGITGAAAGGLAPPDTHGAVGNTQYAQIVNAALRVFTKGTTTTQPTVLKTVTLKALFGTTETVFDPRIVYDDRWDRWVVVATRRAVSETDTVKKFFLAISSTSLASGGWCTYGVNFFGGVIQNGDWWDYPQLGMDLDGLIITGNVFHRIGTTTTNTFRTTAVLPIPKAQVYNCLGFSVPKFENLVGTLAPPLVRDTSGSAFIISANSGVVRKYTLTNSSRTTAALAGPVVISGVATFFVPADATQPGTTTRLDTLDGRFVNASTQVGTTLWNTHAVATATGGIPRVRWYRINTTLNNIAQQSTISEASAGTHSFNASIAANDSNGAVITYTSSSTTVRAQMRFTGKQAADVSMPTGTLVATSAFSFTTPNPSRWGDYSAVSVDPTNQNRFWITNQLVGGGSQFTWRTRMARVGF
jgi:hypothetical protein